MAQSVLGSLALGYRLLWGRHRTLMGVRLFVHADGTDGQHLLRTLGELRSAEWPAFILSLRSTQLLKDVLDHASNGSPLIEVPLAWTADAAVAQAVRGARERGAALMASGTPEQQSRVQGGGYARRAIELSAPDAALALRAARETGPRTGRATESPITPDSLVFGVASRALADHALDQQGAWAVEGWPVDDVLHRYRGQPLPPTRNGIMKVMRTLDGEPSLERIEAMFAREPTLAYRLLVYLNSAGLGLRGSISSLRHGFMMLGYRTLNTWLGSQLPHASDDLNLLPINAQMVMRAHLTSQLMDAGIEDDLRREAYLCGLFSELEAVQDEELRVSFARIPLPEMLVDALQNGAGPYAPALRVATALEGAEPAPLIEALSASELNREEINRALLRLLSTARSA